MPNRIPYCAPLKSRPLRLLVKNVMQPYAAQFCRKYMATSTRTAGWPSRAQRETAWGGSNSAASRCKVVSRKLLSSAEIHLASRG